MSDDAAREAETVDIEPYEGKPDKLDRIVDGVQDDSKDASDISEPTAQPVLDVTDGEPVGGQELAPTAPKDEVDE